MKTTIFLKSVLSLLIICTISSKYIYSQDKSYTCNEIIKLLEGGMEQQEIINNLKKLKTTCDLNDNTEMIIKLVNAGANKFLLDAITQFRYAELIITAPNIGAEVGATVKIEGTSVPLDERHLWVFLQREGLQVWWPQGGEVILKSDNSWGQGAFVGSPQDIGFDFVVKALWVDNKVNRDLKDYVAKTSASGNYYGIPLPEGKPSTSITVHKVRH